MPTPLRALIVEDSPDDCTLLVRELQRGGYDLTYERVDTPAPMQAALDQQPWDIVISDYAMPHFSAPAALTLLRERERDLPFIIVSGTIGEDAAVAALKAGAHDFIGKGQLARLIPAIERELHEASERSARRKAEAALHESEERFRRLAEHAPDMIFRYRLTPTPGFDYVSPVATTITGYIPADYYADPDLGVKLMHPDDRGRFESLGPLFSASDTPFTTRWVRKDGTVIWVDQRIVPINDATGNRVALEGIARDVTAQMQAEAALRVSEQRYRSLVETSPDSIALTDLDGMIILCNQQTARLYGYERAEELLWRSMFAFVAPEDVARARSLLQNLPAQGNVSNIEYTLLKGDGARFPAEVSASMIVDSEGQFTASVFLVRDITERKRSEAQSHRQLARLAALRMIDMAITASLDLRVTLNVVLDQVTSQLDIDAADVLLLNTHTQTLEYAAGRGFRAGALQHPQPRLGEGYAGRAALERRTLNIPNLADAEEMWRTPRLAGEGFIAYFGVPLLAKGQIKGVLEILHRAPLTPEREWLDFLEALAGQTAIAIDNAALFDDLQHSNVELTLAYDTTLEGWSRALDLRDKETEGHTQRVTEVTLQLARAIGMSPAELVHVRRGALLHDIGKMGIPDAILLKPGPLTDDEWDIMRKHPVYAYGLLAPITFLKEALDIPYCHHEKWDSTGYPRRLTGEQIPFGARIFAVVDVWDALRSDRPYRKGQPEDQVRAHIRALAGTHFDPQVVRVFLELEVSHLLP